MGEIDPELRDKIIETHTLVKRIDEDHKEHKVVMNARLRDARKELDAHKKETKETHEKHDQRIEAGERFRLRVITYASSAAFVGALIIDPVVSGVKRFFGI